MGFGLFYPWGIVLQAMAILHFVRRRPDTFWLWVILLGGGLGALVYMVAEVVPDLGLLRGSVNRFSRKRRIRGLEALILENPAIGNYEELADLCLEEGKFARARELYDRVIAGQRDSRDVDAFYRRGLAELALADPAAAVLDLERVIAHDPKYDFNRAIGLLAHAYGVAGQLEKADALFKTATEVSTLSETYYNYAVFLAAHERKAEAKDWADRMLAWKKTLPGYLRRRDRAWFRKASALVKKL